MTSSSADDLEKLMAAPSGTIATTRLTSLSGEPERVTTEMLTSRFERLEGRMDRIESVLNNILEHLNLPKVGVPDHRTQSIKSAITQHGNTSINDRDDVVNQAEDDCTIGHGQERKYAYSPLDAAKSQFRVLRVRRAENLMDLLLVELVTVGLDDSSIKSLLYGFVALSYTWGPPVFDGLVMLDGCKFPITKSLEAALRQQRFAYKDNAEIVISGQSWGQECYVWVDQICINQSDLDERANQVGLMRRIYKRASSVQVWLGEEADNSSLAIDLLTTLGVPPKHAPGEKTITYPSFTEAEVMRNWDALRALFKRPWWERVWIRQEIALHRVVKVWCGSKTFNMGILPPALFMLAHISSLGFANTTSHSDSDQEVSLPWDYHPKMLAELRKMAGNGSSWVGLAQLLRLTRSCKATDGRDTVFSVLGLANPELHQLFPDYRQDLKDVLFSTVKAVLGLEHGIDILGVCQNSERKLGLPSWVPLLTEKWKAMPFQTADRRGKRLIPRLTAATLPLARVEGNTLALKGGIFDTIKAICSSHVNNNVDVDATELVYESWKKFAKDAAVEQRLGDKSRSDAESEVTRQWIRFLTVLVDEAESLEPDNFQGPGTFDGPDIALNNRSINPYYRVGLNPKLSRCYLLPPSYVDASPHPNHRIHAGIQLYGVGRRLCTTSRGQLALIPAEAQVGDSIAIFVGASFPYVLRKSGHETEHVLVGEAFVTTWVAPQRYGPLWDGYAEDLLRRGGHSYAEDLLRKKKHFALDVWIHIS